MQYSIYHNMQYGIYHNMQYGIYHNLMREMPVGMVVKTNPKFLAAVG
jgi:hypothetical protein